MDLVHDGHADVPEEGCSVYPPRNQHDLEGFRRGQEHVRRVLHDSLARGRADIAVPQSRPASEQPAVSVEALGEIVQERAYGADVEHGEAGPSLGEHA
jgi:hypothetical protein